MKRWFDENFGWPLQVIVGISFLIVYVIPAAWFREIPGMNQLLEVVPAMLPGIRQYIAVSKMGDIASIYFPIMVLVSPIALLEAWRLSPFRTRWTTNFWAHPLKNTVRQIIGVALAIGGCYVTYVVGGYEAQAFSVRDSHFYLALLGGVYAGGGFWIVVGLLSRSIFSLLTNEHIK